MNGSPIIISSELLSAIHRVWQQIGSDVLASAEAVPGQPEIDNAEAIESCVDADRLHPNSGFNDRMDAYLEYRNLLEVHGYNEVLQALADCPFLQLV